MINDPGSKPVDCADTLGYYQRVQAEGALFQVHQNIFEHLKPVELVNFMAIVNYKHLRCLFDLRFEFLAGWLISLD